MRRTHLKLTIKTPAWTRCSATLFICCLLLTLNTFNVMYQYISQCRQICVVTKHINLSIKHIFFIMSTTTRMAAQNLSPTRTCNPVYHCLYVLNMSNTRFRVNPHSIVEWMSRNFSLETGTPSEARPVWQNGWVFVYELSGLGFESRCSYPVYHHHKRINFLSNGMVRQW